uniref:Uncharacterized protein n=1 Tax=viral metagenome TaxID=1070528 RepID=A0A6H1ZEG3_9ZZZZ
MTVAEITKEIMKGMELTQEQFAVALTQSLVNIHISRVSVSYWLNGKYEPELDFLFWVRMAHTDWRRKWANACLAAMLPEALELDTKGGLRLIEA